MHRTRNGILFEIVVALLFAGVVAMIAYVASRQLPTSYRTTVTWSVVNDPVRTGGDAEAFLDAPRRDEVLREAWALLGEPDAVQSTRDLLASAVRATLANDPVVGPALRIEVAAGTPELATRWAQALATALEGWDVRTTPDRAEAYRAELDRRIEAMNERIRSQQVLGADAPGDAIERSVAERAELVQERERVDAWLAGGAGAGALGAATTTHERSGPRPLRNAGVAGIVGLVLGVALGPVWGGAPGARRPAPGGPPARSRAMARIPRFGPDGVPGDAVAAVRRAVLGATFDASPRSVVVTGVVPGVGATTVAIALAGDLARQGHPTVLVDGNLRAPALMRRFGWGEGATLPVGVGTTLAWLQDPDLAHEVAVREPSPGTRLDLVLQDRAVRAVPGREEELFGGFGEVLARWGGYRTIVIDSASVALADDTVRLARHATGVLLVTPARRRERGDLARARRILRLAGVRVLGWVENDAPPPSDAP